MTLEEALSKIVELKSGVESKEAELVAALDLAKNYETKLNETEAQLAKTKEANMSMFLKLAQEKQDITPNPPTEPQPEPQPEVQDWDSFMAEW